MSDKQPSKRGRRIRKNPELIEQICEGIALGKSAREVCVKVGIGQRTLWDWLALDEDFAQQYAHAKEMCADILAEEIIAIADDSSHDTYIDDEGNTVTDHEAIQRDRLRVDARKWYASKLLPRKYGDRLVNQHEGGDPERPILHNIKITFVPGRKPETGLT